jgi:hypothetical protein
MLLPLSVESEIACQLNASFYQRSTVLPTLMCSLEGSQSSIAPAEECIEDPRKRDDSETVSQPDEIREAGSRFDSELAPDTSSASVELRVASSWLKFVEPTRPGLTSSKARKICRQQGHVSSFMSQLMMQLR